MWIGSAFAAAHPEQQDAADREGQQIADKGRHRQAQYLRSRFKGGEQAGTDDQGRICLLYTSRCV